MRKQVDAVSQALATTIHPDCRVIPVLCFVDSSWGIGGAPFVIGDVHVLWPKMLGKLVRNAGTLSIDEVAELERRLALALPIA